MTAVHALSATPGPEPDAEALPPGTTLLGGQYTILRFLGSGGFGITYLARDSLDRMVVIKECFPEALCSRKQRSVRTRSSNQAGEFQSLVAMFVREARSVAKLKHPNIVGVHQVFEDNDTAYMALDLIDGEDLLDKLEKDADSLSPAVITAILRTLLDAIALVHDQDMLHRDISPDNVLMDRKGNPVLIDFGAAREEASKKSRAISALLVVKDGYSPQEFYISGGRQGPFSDLYSLAATIYHLITGAPPVNSQNRLAALAANRPDPYVPLAGRVDGYESAVLASIDKAMNVFPDDRIQSARDWIEMIDPARKAAAQEAQVRRNGDIKKIISQLVDEVDQSIAEDSRKAKVAAAIPEPVAPRKLEYLLPEDEMPDFDPPEDMADLDEPPSGSDPGRWPRLRRRLGAALVIFAMAFSISQSPAASISVEPVNTPGHDIERGQGATGAAAQESAALRL